TAIRFGKRKQLGVERNAQGSVSESTRPAARASSQREPPLPGKSRVSGRGNRLGRRVTWYAAQVSDRFPALRSRGGDLAVPAAGVLLVLGLATLILGATRDPGLPMLLLCALAAILGAAAAL